MRLAPKLTKGEKSGAHVRSIYIGNEPTSSLCRGNEITIWLIKIDLFI